MVGERQTNEVLVSLNFMSFFLTFESLKTKTYVFCWFFRFFLKEKTLQEFQTSLAAETLDHPVPEKTLPVRRRTGRFQVENLFVGSFRGEG